MVKYYNNGSTYILIYMVGTFAIRNNNRSAGNVFWHFKFGRPIFHSIKSFEIIDSGYFYKELI